MPPSRPVGTRWIDDIMVEDGRECDWKKERDGKRNVAGAAHLSTSTPNRVASPFSSRFDPSQGGVPVLADLFVDGPNFDGHTVPKGRVRGQQSHGCVPARQREDDNAAQTFLGLGERA